MRRTGVPRAAQVALPPHGGDGRAAPERPDDIARPHVRRRDLLRVLRDEPGKRGVAVQFFEDRGPQPVRRKPRLREQFGSREARGGGEVERQRLLFDVRGRAADPLPGRIHRRRRVRERRPRPDGRRLAEQIDAVLAARRVRAPVHHPTGHAVEVKLGIGHPEPVADQPRRHAPDFADAARRRKDEPEPSAFQRADKHVIARPRAPRVRFQAEPGVERETRRDRAHPVGCDARELVQPDRLGLLPGEPRHDAGPSKSSKAKPVSAASGA